MGATIPCYVILNLSSTALIESHTFNLLCVELVCELHTEVGVASLKLRALTHKELPSTNPRSAHGDVHVCTL